MIDKAQLQRQMPRIFLQAVAKTDALQLLALLLMRLWAAAWWQTAVGREESHGTLPSKRVKHGDVPHPCLVDLAWLRMRVCYIISDQLHGITPSAGRPCMQFRYCVLHVYATKTAGAEPQRSR